jgi:Holliday junction resolvase-like predicted endonuclease
MTDAMNQLAVTKASGDKVLFSSGKLRQSLRKAGADEEMIQEVFGQIDPLLYEGIPTHKIYKHAFAILKKLSKTTAARYSLRQGIMQLGPSGFPFEKFVAELLAAQGYQYQVGVFVDGHCVRHEIDVIATKDGKRYMIECKYHNMHHKKSDVKVPMYIQSRFKDVEQVWLSGQEYEVRFHQVWVMTNTRFTEDAIRFATCMNMRLIGWDYPAKGGLKDLVDSFELYPLTCLTTLTRHEKQRLLDQKVVLCKELHNNAPLLLSVGLTDNKIEKVLNEVNSLCGS